MSGEEQRSAPTHIEWVGVSSSRPDDFGTLRLHRIVINQAGPFECDLVGPSVRGLNIFAHNDTGIRLVLFVRSVAQRNLIS